MVILGASNKVFSTVPVVLILSVSIAVTLLNRRPHLSCWFIVHEGCDWAIDFHEEEAEGYYLCPGSYTRL